MKAQIVSEEQAQKEMAENVEKEYTSKRIKEDKFKAYLVVQKSGATNMFMIPAVIKLAKAYCDVVLTKEDCLDIMKNYAKYEKEFGVEID